MLTLTINGRQVRAEEGATILNVARENNIYIPSLCDHEAVAPYGACRLCLVEVTMPNGRQRTVTSCLYPVAEGLVVKTDTEQITTTRRMLLELLLSRCPDSEVIQEMAASLGVTKSRFKPQKDNNKCILCGLCARVCHEVVGVSAISLADRGVNRRLSTPFNEDFSEACIGCGSCSYVCPTGAITSTDSSGLRTIKWPHNEMEFKLARCPVCGNYWAPQKQIEYIAGKSGTAVDDYNVCPDCRD